MVSQIGSQPGSAWVQAFRMLKVHVVLEAVSKSERISAWLCTNAGGLCCVSTNMYRSGLCSRASETDQSAIQCKPIGEI